VSSIQIYNIYCDETFLHSRVAFAIGGLICTPRRSEILDTIIMDIRSRRYEE